MAYKDKESKRAYDIAYYQSNKKKRLEKQNSWRRLWRDYIEELKGSTPCIDCNRFYPAYVMDFDHVRGTKSHNVSAVARFSSFDALKEEIAKCEIVCANCHRIRTFLRKQESLGHSQVG